MKYNDISGFSILALSLLQGQMYSSEVLVAPQAKSQNKAEDFLFTRFGCSPDLKLFPRDVQYLIVQHLKELIVGKIDFGKAYRETRPLPSSRDKPTVKESLLTCGASLVNLVAPGTFEELPSHLDGHIEDLVFTSDETHVVCASSLIHFVVNLHRDRRDPHGAATFVEWVDLKHRPNPIYKTEWIRDEKKFRRGELWDGLYCEYYSDKSDSRGIKPIKFTCGLPLVLYQEICRLQGKPLWERRGDLQRLLEEYPIHRIRRTSDSSFSIGIGSLEVPFVTLSDDLIGKYHSLEGLTENPSEVVGCPEAPRAAIVKDSTLLFCRFIDVPPRDHPHYELIYYGLNKVGKEYRSAVSANNRFLLLTIKEHKVAEPDEKDTWELKERLRYKITNHFHAWDLQSGRCLQKFTVKGDIDYATICPNGRFALVLCHHFEGAIKRICEPRRKESESIILLYHIPSALIIGYQRRTTCKGAFSGSGKLFVTADSGFGRSDINPSIYHTLRIWKLDQFIELEELYKGQVLIEHALFILLLRELKSQGTHLSVALPELARAGGVEEIELRNYFKVLYRSLPDYLQIYLVKLMGA